MSYYIYSTHTNPIQYVEYDTKSGRNHNIIKRRFVVMGGHGLCNKNLVTLEGVVTKVEREDDMNWLNSLPAFKADIAKGFIRVTKRKEESEKIVKRDMNPKDGSAPKTPKDYEKVATGSEHVYTTSNSNAANARF